MATESAYPDALPTLTDVPATFAELPKHSTQHNVNNADTVAIATKLGITSGFKGIERYADNAARDAALPSPTEGMVVWSGPQLQVNIDSSAAGWRIVWQEPVTISASSVTAGSGWTLDELDATLLSTRLAVIVGTVTRTGGTITVPSNGNIPNSTLCTLPASFGGTSIEGQGLASRWIGRMGAFVYQPSTREVSVGAVAGGSANLVNGEQLSFGGMVALDFP